MTLRNRKSPHSIFKASIPTTFHADITEAASRLTRAEGQARGAQDIGRNLLAIGLDVVRRCPSCAAAIFCTMHGTAAVTEMRGHEAEPESVDPDVAANYPALVDYYYKAFIDARGERPAFAAQDGAAIKKLLKEVGFERASRAVANAYASRYFKGHATIRSIAADPSKYLGEPATGNATTLQADSGFGKAKDQ